MASSVRRTIAVMSVLAGTVAGPALAADAAWGDLEDFRPAYGATAGTNWSGPYLGAQFGHGWGGSSNDWSIPGLVDWTPDGDIDATSLTGGLYAGYQQQLGSAVFGVEADFSLARFRGDDSSFAGRVNGMAIDGVASLRGRLGWAMDNLLLYGTAGLAVADFTKTDAGAAAATPQLARGWAAGGGVELALADRWRLRAEYLHLGFGTIETPLEVGGGGYRHRANAPHLDLIRAGIGYAF